MSAPLQASRGTQFARILSGGSAVPSRVIDNAYLCQFIDSSDEWIQQRTGIVERRWLDTAAGEDLHSLALEASRKAIERSDLAPAEIDALVLSTVSLFQQTPALAPQLAAELGMEQAPAYDISAGCAGFCYALAQAEGLIRGGQAHNVLVIGAETLSRLTNLEDRGTAFLFSDGAGAAVVGGSQTNGLGPVIWGSDGANADLITTAEWEECLAAGAPPKLAMNGQAVFKWATSFITKIAKQALDAAGIGPEDLDVFIPHQANNRITDTMLRYLKLPEHVVVARSIKKYGNNSSATVPIAMDELLTSGQAKSGQTALIVGFGSGLVYAGQVVTLP
jgi:3-oxoacyl-[acyl-carrier-protein] synthase-3